MAITSFILYPIPPFQLDYTIWALKRRAKNIVDQWDGVHYTRLFIIDNTLIKATLEQINAKNNSQIYVTTNIELTKLNQHKLTDQLELMLGLKSNLENFYTMAKQDPRLKPLVMQFLGLKPPRFPTIFEALVNAISCQQISLDAGLQIQNKLVQYIDLSLSENKNKLYAFPRAEDVAKCTVTSLKKLGYSIKKSETLIRLASYIADNKLTLNNFENKSNDEIINFLCDFKGIGIWSAEYVLLRGLGKIETFPHNDIGAQKNLQELFNIEKNLNYSDTSAIIAKWYPYAGLVYFHLLLYRLREKQIIW